MSGMDNGSGGVHTAPLMAAPESMPLDSRSMKARIFSSARKKPKSKIVDFFGEKIEIRQPTLSEMMAYAAAAAQDEDTSGVMILINYSYVPGTDEKMFTLADKDSLMSLPYSEDFIRATAAFNEVTGFNVEAATKNSETNPSVSK